MAATVVKDPQETKDFQLDWTARLVEGETISASSWAADTGITVSTSSSTETLTTVRLTGGTAGTTYRVTNTMTTSLGRIYEDTLNVQVRSL